MISIGVMLSNDKEILRMLSTINTKVEQNLNFNIELLKKEDGYMSVGTLAGLYGVRRETIFKWCKNTNIDSMMIKGERYFNHKEFKEVLKKN